MRLQRVTYAVLVACLIALLVSLPGAVTADAPESLSRPSSYELSAPAKAGTDRVRAQSAPIVIQRSRSVSIMLNSGRDRTFGAGETIWVRGRVTDARGRAMVGKKVRILRYAGPRSSTEATIRTNSRGWYSYSTRATDVVTYRAYVSAKQYSGKSTFRPGGDRTLEVRERSLSFGIGKARGPVVSSEGLRWRAYASGTLVQNGSRTWFVRGRILNAWQKAGGPTGSLGAPIADQRCRLPEGACIQKFERGTAYNNHNSPTGVTTAVRSANVDPTLAAVALSQAGRTIKLKSYNKYLQWRHPDGTKVSWCGIFLSWLAYAAGEPAAVPASKDYAELIDEIRSEAVISQQPAVGRLAFISNVIPGKATHAGIVVGVAGGKVTTVEANVASDGGPSLPRGVFRTVHDDPDDIIFYADPLD